MPIISAASDYCRELQFRSLACSLFFVHGLFAGSIVTCAPLASASPNSQGSEFALVTLLREGVVYNFQGDLAAADVVWTRVRDLDPTHPAGPFFEVSTLYWRQTFDAADTQYDVAILSGARETIYLADARLEHNAEDAEALFYRGQAKMNIARLEVVRGHYFKAGGVGEEAREDLERVLQLDSSFIDAKHQLGMYYYYAAKLPSVMKWLNFLWFIPKGDGPLGLQYLNDVVSTGDLMRYDASTILLSIQVYLDPDPEPALELAMELHEQFPTSTLIHFQVIEALTALKDGEGVIRESLLLEQSEGKFFHDAGRRRMVMIWRAGAELELGRPEKAWQVLESFGQVLQSDPGWALPWVSLIRGRVVDVLGLREEALKYYRVVTRLKSPQGDPVAAALAKKHIKKPYQIDPLQLNGR
jgi:tetratricopeptide (TPR) repeat protein